MIVHAHDKEGAFICGDTATGITCYSYPSSANAQQARKVPDKIAKLALANQTRHGFTSEIDYDARNWRRLDIAGLVPDALRTKLVTSFDSRLYQNA